MTNKFHTILNLFLCIFRFNRDLEHIILGHNQLKVVEKGAFTYFTNLTYLFLWYNQLKTISISATVQNLFILNNFIETIECDEAAHFDIEVLHISNNQLKNINCITNMHKLRRFHGNFNNISVISENIFEKLSSLEDLYLSNNLLKTLYLKMLVPLKNLTFLSVNDISSYDDVHEVLPNLRHLELSIRGWNSTYLKEVTEILNRQNVTLEPVKSSF